MILTKLFLVMMMVVLMAITFFTNSVYGFNENNVDSIITGLNAELKNIFTAINNTFEVRNVARVQKDPKKYISIKFSLKNKENHLKVLGLKNQSHINNKSKWEVNLNDDTVLDIKMKILPSSQFVQEMVITWPGNIVTQTKNRELCFSLGKDVKWFNTYQQFHQQWPMDLTKTVEKLPFNSFQKDDTSELQHIVEGTFFGSNGFIIRLNNNSPLWYRIVPGDADPQMCISTVNKTPYNSKNLGNNYLDISFTLFAGVDLKQAYLGMSNHLLGNKSGIPRPPKVPDAHMFDFPIWSIIPSKTLPNFPGSDDLTSIQIENFAKSLSSHSQYHCIINLDTWWQLEKEYLIVEMQQKLRDIDNLSKKLNTANNLDYRLQLSISPFVHSESSFFKSNRALLVQNAVNGSPFVEQNGKHANHGFLDFSNPATRSWLIDRLRLFQKNYHISSFVFEPITISGNNLKFNSTEMQDVPSLYSHEYAKMAVQLADSDTGSKSLASVKEARGNQDLSLFVHMSSRVSDWTDTRGIKSLIPTALALSLAGYSFIVPDLVGGRLPGPDNSPIPNGELYTRWAQATALMPAMQFATPPWYYTNKTITKAVLQAIILHQNTVKSHISRLANNRVNGDGSPIMRPMWWADPEDINLYQKGIVDTQFLLDDELTSNYEQILVAPILEQGKTERQVYLPKGNWIQQNGGEETNTQIQSGPLFVTGNADIGHLLWYKREI